MKMSFKEILEKARKEIDIANTCVCQGVAQGWVVEEPLAALQQEIEKLGLNDHEVEVEGL